MAPSLSQPTAYADPRMDIERLREHWDGLAQVDPLWAVLSERSREGGSWDLEEFLRTGAEKVDTELAALHERGVVVARGRALDFGCGVGRLTQALAELFESCDGVDISASMIELARRVNRHGERCRYHVNAAADLSLFADETFDFVLSSIVLQHMEPRYALRYVREFVRLLRPNGVALFQLPSERRDQTPEPLPPEALRAELAVAHPPRALRRGETVTIVVRVRNASPVAWPEDAELRAGNHWRDRGGGMLVHDDGRADLGGGLRPGEEGEVSLTVTAPSSPGPWTLEVDLVQELVAWFATRGAPPLRIEVEDAGRKSAEPVPPTRPGASGDPELAATPSPEPWIPMYVVPHDEVLAYVEAAGGHVEHSFPDSDAGEAYESFHYVVRRGPAESTRAALRRATDAVAELPDRPDMLPPLTSRRRRRRARQAELAIRRAVARATRWSTIAQVEHDRTATRALMEMQAVIAAHEAEIRELRAELGRRDTEKR